MWLSVAPSPDEELRQGDLLTGIVFPKAGTVQFEPEGVVGEVDDAVAAVVLDHCCTVEQHHVVLLARVQSMKVSERMMQGLTNVEPSSPGPYARYAHLLAPHEAIPVKTGKNKVINLLDRAQLLGGGFEDFAWLRGARKARMTTIARAHLRLKLAVHFGRAEDEDLAMLMAEGLDSFGRPTPTVRRGLGGEAG